MSQCVHCNKLREHQGFVRCLWIHFQDRIIDITDEWIEVHDNDKSQKEKRLFSCIVFRELFYGSAENNEVHHCVFFGIRGVYSDE